MTSRSKGSAKIRIARYSDVPRISQILAASFSEEGLHQKVFPYRHDYYSDYERSWRFKCMERFWDYSRIYVVSTIDAPDDQGDKDSAVVKSSPGPTELVVGVAEWQRVGLGWEQLWGCLGWWDPRKLVLPMVKLFTGVHYAIFGNRAVVKPSPEDPTPLTVYNFESRMGPFVAHHFTSPPHRKNHWELATLGVDPGYQGQGIGTQLVSWGLHEAKKEELPAVVIGAEGLEDFYERAGFEFLVGYATEGMDAHGNENPLKLAGVGGGCIRWTRVKEDGAKHVDVEKSLLATESNV